eukprot:359735-Chlamydomonas_euryale.AAC.2
MQSQVDCHGLLRQSTNPHLHTCSRPSTSRESLSVLQGSHTMEQTTSSTAATVTALGTPPAASAPPSPLPPLLVPTVPAECTLTRPLRPLPPPRRASGASSCAVRALIDAAAPPKSSAWFAGAEEQHVGTER